MKKIHISLPFALSCLACLVQPGLATVPDTITIQGTLEAPGGGPLTGTYSCAVRIWDASVEGNLLVSTLNPITLSDSGRFSLELPLEDVFVPPHQAWYDLGVDTDYDGIEEEEFFPHRVRFHSVPFARVAANAELLGGYPATAFVLNGSASSEAWELGGNATSSGNFLGTTNNQSLELRVNNQRGLILIPNSNSPNLVGGYSSNTIGAAVEGGTIGGGGTSSDPNQVTGNYGTVSGGKNNTAQGQYSTVAGGQGNQALSNLGTIGGGDANVATNEADTVSGGQGNVAGGGGATIGGGGANRTFGFLSTIAGGFDNRVSGTNATVGGGQLNQASGEYSTVSGGDQNKADGKHASVGGGQLNQASADYATVAGGRSNKASGRYAIVAGGGDNEASGTVATIGGGDSNLAGGLWATVAGGSHNVAGSDHAAVGGGLSNLAGGVFSIIPGGEGNTASGDYSFAAGRRSDALGAGSFVWGDSNNKIIHAWGDNQFVARATGGFWFITAIDANGAPTEGMRLPAGASTWLPIGTSKANEDHLNPGAIQILQKENADLKQHVENLETRLEELETLILARTQP